MSKPRDVALLENLLSDPGWLLYKSRNETIITYWEKLLLLPGAQRKDLYPDDFLRGRIDALRRATDWPASEVAKFNEAVELEQEEDAEVNMQNAANDHIARLGHKFPLTFSTSGGSL